MLAATKHESPRFKIWRLPAMVAVIMPIIFGIMAFNALAGKGDTFNESPALSGVDDYALDRLGYGGKSHRPTAMAVAVPVAELATMATNLLQGTTSSATNHARLIKTVHLSVDAEDTGQQLKTLLAQREVRGGLSA